MSKVIQTKNYTFEVIALPTGDVMLQVSDKQLAHLGPIGFVMDRFEADMIAAALAEPANAEN